MSTQTPEEKAANISVKGAWLVAAVTVLGSLIISVITGVITGQQAASSTDRQIKAASEQSQADFLRQQRQAIYGKFLSDVAINQQCQFDLDADINSKKGTPLGHFDLTPINQMLAKCATLTDDLGQELGPVSLVSSNSISSQAQSLWDSLSEGYGSLAGFVQAVIDHSNAAADLEVHWNRDFGPIDDKLKAITTAMKNATYGS